MREQPVDLLGEVAGRVTQLAELRLGDVRHNLPQMVAVVDRGPTLLVGVAILNRNGLQGGTPKHLHLELEATSGAKLLRRGGDEQLNCSDRHLG